MPRRRRTIRPSRTSSPPWPRSTWTTPSAAPTAPTPRWWGCPSACAAQGGRPAAGPRGRSPGPAAGRARAPVRRPARRRQDRGQDRHPGEPAAAARPAAAGRRHGQHLPGRPGARPGGVAVRARPAGPGPRDPGARQSARGWRSCCPRDLVVADDLDNPHPGGDGAGGPHPGRDQGPGRRTGDAQGLRRGGRPGADAVLERSAGRVREAALRRRHPRGGAGAGELLRASR